MDIILYTTGCPRCRALRQILDDHKIKYTVCTNIESMQKLGIVSVPVLSIDGSLMGYNDAVEWAMNQQEDMDEKQ